MEKNQLERANEIEKLLASKKQNLDNWSRAIRFADQITVYVKGSGNSNSYKDYVNNDYVDFETVKILTMAKLQNDIAILEQEFKNL